MRRDREASWYLGLNWGDSHYLMFYLGLRGDAELRDECARLLWYHLRVTRSLAVASGQSSHDIAMLRREITEILRLGRFVDRLDDILFAFSVIDRDHGFVHSGHFGNARPCVLGVENKVSAFNQSEGRLRDGRDLRYWEVLSAFGFNNVYVLSYDTSRIQSTVQMGTDRPDLRANADTLFDERSVMRLLDGARNRGELPRYYLGVVRKKNADASELLAPTRDAS